MTETHKFLWENPIISRRLGFHFQLHQFTFDEGSYWLPPKGGYCYLLAFFLQELHPWTFYCSFPGSYFPDWIFLVFLVDILFSALNGRGYIHWPKNSSADLKYNVFLHYFKHTPSLIVRISFTEKVNEYLKGLLLKREY